MNAQQYNQLFSFIWNIANDVLVNVFVKGDYKKIILPMMVLRRLDILLEPTHKAVRKQRDKLIEMNAHSSVKCNTVTNVGKKLHREFYSLVFFEIAHANVKYNLITNIGKNFARSIDIASF